MAIFTDNQWIERSEINGGVAYVDYDGVLVDDINSLVNNIFYLYSQLKSKNIV